ncbi:MAG: phage baseplate assembly protein V [Clostridia bacterium]|nr:phage baseplate assembly protein V [Clostridia bacterium]
MDSVFRTIKKITKPVADRAALSIARAILKVVNDSLPIQAVQIDLLAGETRDKVERLQEYGFTSVPLSGCRGIALFIGGDRSHGAVIATDDNRYRKKGLASGEVAIYTDEGDSIHLKRGRIIEITAVNGVVVNAPTVTVPSGDVIASGISLVNHVHPGCQGGTTGTPI